MIIFLLFRRHLSQFSEQSVEQSMRDVHTCIRGLPIIQQCMESVQRKSSWVGNLPQPTNFRIDRPYSNNNTDRTLDVVFSRYMGFCSKQPKAEAQRSYEHALTLPNNWTRHTVNSFGCCLMVIVKKNPNYWKDKIWYSICFVINLCDMQLLFSSTAFELTNGTIQVVLTCAYSNILNLYSIKLCVY